MSTITKWLVKVLGANWATVLTNWMAALAVFGALLSTTWPNSHAVTVACGIIALASRLLHGYVSADDLPTAKPDAPK